MAYLGAFYRTYALDFWGFGESGKKRNSNAIQDFVTLVDQFMDRLGISCAPLVGHSMGGMVSLSVAVQYPRRVSKVVVGSPIVGSSLAFPLKMAGRRLIAMVLFNTIWAFRMGMRLALPFICKDPRFPAMMDKDLSRTTVESFLLSITSLHQTDLRPILSQVKVPAMGKSGEKDIIVHPDQWQSLLEGIPHTRVERFSKAGHFIILDDPAPFMQKLKDFLDEDKPTA
jgi:pimeloyl-ACP methyl ester carboxylesterase